MSFIYLAIYILLISFVCSAISGVIMFFVDIIRFGTPHKRFKTVSSIEKYNENLAKIESEIKDTASDQSVDSAEPLEIDL